MASKVEGGSFAKQCGTSSMHSYWKIQPNQKIVQRTKIRKEQLSVLDKVHKNELHSTRVSYCIGCLAFAEKTCTECAGNKCIETVDTESQTEIQKLVDAFCQTELLDLPKPEDLTPDERKQLAFNLGKCESKRVHEDCKSLTSEYKDLDVLMKLNIDVYKRKRNKVVLAFLDGISQENSESKDIAKHCITVEQIYSLNYPYLVAPFSFLSNLVQYQTTQSRFSLDLNSKLYPSGSYPVVCNWLSSQSTTELHFPDKDCMVAFDNDQIVGKTWYIKANNKVNASVVTSLCTIQFDSCYQFNNDLHPKKWFRYEGFIEKLKQVRNKYGSEYDSVHNVHYQHLYVNLGRILQRVYNEQKTAFNGDSFKDPIDNFVHDEMLQKQEIGCALCGKVYKKTKIKCDTCKVNLRECNKRNSNELETLDDKPKIKKRKSKRTENEVNFLVTPENNAEIANTSTKLSIEQNTKGDFVQVLELHV